MPWSARWFNGRDSVAHPALVELMGDELHVDLPQESTEPRASLVYLLASVITSEPFTGTARLLQLPDGSTLAVDDSADAGFDDALRRAGCSPGRDFGLMQSWRAAIACLVMLLALLVWLDRQGAGMLASLALPVVPIRVDQQLGTTVGAIIEQRWMAPSDIPEVRQRRLNARVKAMVDAQHPDLAWSLAFRNMRNEKDAFNAFTLPGGTIVLLDGLTGDLTDDQVIAVVGHELGHVRHRDTMQRVLRQVGLLAAAGVILGDVSNLAVGATAGFQDLHYSREAESEADAFAIGLLRRGGVPLRHMVEAFEEIQRYQTSSELPDFLSSHPPTAERLRLAREAAAE